MENKFITQTSILYITFIFKEQTLLVSYSSILPRFHNSEFCVRHSFYHLFPNLLLVVSLEVVSLHRLSFLSCLCLKVETRTHLKAYQQDQEEQLEFQNGKGLYRSSGHFNPTETAIGVHGSALPLRQNLPPGVELADSLQLPVPSGSTSAFTPEVCASCAAASQWLSKVGGTMAHHFGAAWGSSMNNLCTRAPSCADFLRDIPQSKALLIKRPSFPSASFISELYCGLKLSLLTCVSFPFIFHRYYSQ